MTVWDWFHAYEGEAQRASDSTRLRLAQLYRAANRVRNTNIDGAIQLLQQGRSLAEQLNEPWWTIFYDHWIAQFLRHYKQNYAAALELSVRTTVEVRKPVYDHLPQRVCVYDDLISAYLVLDPVGYADLIEPAIAYMETEIDSSTKCCFCPYLRRIEFACAMNDMITVENDVAFFEGLTETLRSSMRGYCQSIACSYRCSLAFDKEDWPLLLSYAEAGEPLAQRANRPKSESTFLMWQALAQQQLGQPEVADRRYRQAIAVEAATDGNPAFYMPLCAYLEAIGEAESALKTRERQLAERIASGSPHYECESRLKICELRARMGILTDADLAAAHDSAGRLRAPARFLARLDKVQRPS